jgi:beta-lactam-binding protein with PASTA domain
MKVSQQAHVVLSLGQRQLQIPLLEGNSLRASRIELLRGGLQIGEVSSIENPSQPVDTVMIQNPRPGAGAATPRVDVLVAQGPHENAYVMPHLIGLTESDAQHRLDVAQLRRKANYVTAPQWPHGAVIDQSPPAGSRIPSSSTIELTIAN